MTTLEVRHSSSGIPDLQAAAAAAAAQGAGGAGGVLGRSHATYELYVCTAPPPLTQAAAAPEQHLGSTCARGGLQQGEMHMHPADAS